MIRAIVVVEAVALALLVLWLGRSARPAPAGGGRLTGIAALLAGATLTLGAFTFGLLPALWRPVDGVAPGLTTLALAACTLLLLWAFRLWCSISRDALAGPGLWLALAWLVLALAGVMSELVGAAILIFLTLRPAWTRELSGWRRVATAVVAPLLFVLMSLWPQAQVREAGLDGRIIPILISPSAPIIDGVLPPALARELALARPLDALLRALLELFRIQLAVLTVRAYTLPMRLHGMSLRRRFTVNYLLVRTIPSVLATLTLLVVGYVAVGVHQASRAREAFERMMARADVMAAALLADPRTARAGEGAEVALDSARGWLDLGGAGAHLVLRTGGGVSGGPGRLATPGTPASLLALADSTPRAGSRRGVIEADSALYLFVRRSAGHDTTRALAVYLALDSTALAQVARRIGVSVTLDIDRSFSAGPGGIRFRLDPRSARTLRPGDRGDARGRGFFLGRSYLPLGDRSGDQASGSRGGLVVELHTTRALLPATIVQVPGWLSTNALMLLLLVALTTLFGLIEGLAVRSGRGVVRSIEEEVGSLRAAATRFGAGELGHRIPVRGDDELSALAGSLNAMAASLERQRGELAEKERLDEDLQVALEIQRRFLPQRPPQVAGLDVAGTSVPSREVGGDLFHYLELPGDRLAVALGDVAGKSVPAALIMSNVMAALRAEVQHEAEVEKSLERINRLLVEQIEPGRFVTLFYGILDPGQGRLRYTSAGHNPPLRVTADGRASWLGEGGVPLGIQADVRYPAVEVPFAPGDLLVAYSDGVTEAEGPERDGRVVLFGDQRLAEAVAEVRTRPAAEIVAGVLAAVRAFAGDRPQADDITMVVVRRL